MGNPIKDVYKWAVRRAVRPALAETEEKVAQLHEGFRASFDAMNRVHADVLNLERTVHEQTGGGVAVWRGTLADGAAVFTDGSTSDGFTRKYRGELDYWVTFKHNPEKFPEIPQGYEQAFAHWQRGRVVELGRFLGFDDEPATDGWCAEQRAVELGPGPFPMLAAARWRSAVAVDPIADGYVAEGLLPSNEFIDGVVFVTSGGEALPLVSGATDLVVIENCLDHVSNPARVLDEIVRVLRPGGLVWLLVDLMEYSDEMHPHSFSEERLRALLGESGLSVVQESVNHDKGCHPMAQGVVRALLRKPD